MKWYFIFLIVAVLILSAGAMFESYLKQEKELKQMELQRLELLIKLRGK